VDPGENGRNAAEIVGTPLRALGVQPMAARADNHQSFPTAPSTHRHPAG
jgi:hypothetical protein